MAGRMSALNMLCVCLCALIFVCESKDILYIGTVKGQEWPPWCLGRSHLFHMHTLDDLRTTTWSGASDYRHKVQLLIWNKKKLEKLLTDPIWRYIEDMIVTCFYEISLFTISHSHCLEGLDIIQNG